MATAIPLALLFAGVIASIRHASGTSRLWRDASPNVKRFR